MKRMLDKENYLGRLRAFAVTLSDRRDIPAWQVLAEGFGASANTREFYRRVVLLIDLAHSARQQVEELSGDPSQALYGEAIQGMGMSRSLLKRSCSGGHENLLPPPESQRTAL